MRRSDFYFDLPESLIAQQPANERTASRLLVLDGQTGECTDRNFVDLLSLLHAGDVLVFNNTQVIPARLHGQKETGGKVEVLIERITDQVSALAHIRASKSPKENTRLVFDNNIVFTVQGREGDLFKIVLAEQKANQSLVDVLNDIGHMPLPPYIQRDDTEIDKTRYQTVYGSKPGAVAAPTAGLHFDETMLASLTEKGIEQVQVTLHVGAGTFQPVRVDNIDEHIMHSEWMELNEAACNKINQAKRDGRRVIAVGTTSVRVLESAAKKSSLPGLLEPCQGDTDIFIKPGYEFKVIDGLLTNFHLPESTLLMLVSAFAGYEHVMEAYRHAVNEKYRFFSYGDAMFITPQLPG